MRLHAKLFLLLVCCFLFSCAGDDDNKSQLTQKTVIVYMCAENSMSDYTQEDVKEMIAGASNIPDNCRLLLYIDDTRLPKIEEIKQDGTLQTVYQYTEEVNSADMEGLQSVLNEIKGLSPSKSYGLVMWSHGEGWLPGRKVGSRSFGVDNCHNTTSNDGAELSMEDIANAVSKSIGIADYIFFDACYMQTVEAVYALRDCCRYVIGSPAQIPGPGAPYDKIMRSLFAEGSSVTGIAKGYYDYYNDNVIMGALWRFGVSLSVVDCSKLDALAVAHKTLITSADFSQNNDVDPESLVLYGYGYNSFGDRECLYIDYNTLVSATAVGTTEYQQWSRALADAVVVSYLTPWLSTSYGLFTIDPSVCCALASYAPELDSEQAYTAYYRQTAWYKDAVDCINN